MIAALPVRASRCGRRSRRPVAGPRREHHPLRRVPQVRATVAGVGVYVADLLAPHLENFSSVRVTDPDGHDRTIAQIRLDVLCRMLGRLAV